MGTKFQVLKWNTLVVLEGANFPTYMFVLVCVIVRVVTLSSDVHFGCIFVFKWVGPIFLGVQMHWVPQVYDVLMLIILYVCKLV